MQSLSTYAGWDIADISTHTNETWVIDDGNGYPYLTWDKTEPVEPSEGSVAISGTGSITPIGEAPYIEVDPNEGVFQIEGGGSIVPIGEVPLIPVSEGIAVISGEGSISFTGESPEI